MRMLLQKGLQPIVLSISTRVELPDILGDLLLRLVWLTCTFFW